MQRAFPGVCGLVLALLILAAASPAPARPLLAAAPTKVLRYSGVGTGGDTWKQHFESHDSPPSVVGDSNGADLDTFTFAFTVSRATGRVVGRGQGHYTTATWHMQGQNGSEGTFSCDVPVKTTSFRVAVAGRAAGSRIRLSLTLPNAYESNTSCSAAATSTPTRSSLSTLSTPRSAGAPWSSRRPTHKS